MRPHYKLRWANSPLHVPLLNPSSLTKSNPKFHKIQALISPMASESVSTKRPICPSCNKPTRVCLCNRLRHPLLHNSVAVTILQHSLEKKHPLNSTRIATIGLKNVDVFTVSDVNFQARFVLRLLDSSGDCRDEIRHLFDEIASRVKKDEFVNNADLKSSIDLTIAKYGAITSFHSKCHQQMSFDQLLSSDTALDEIRKGFVVKKIEKNGTEEHEEFEIAVPVGSVLLFPSERSVEAGDLNLEVKNLIVLDGTWAKAKRMYNENPWLRVLPHVRLDRDELSLYREVRHQPRAGYLSTIESIVYAMRAVGEEDAEGLDGLLDVFESMVGDQRRCKHERMSEVFGKK